MTKANDQENKKAGTVHTLLAKARVLTGAAVDESAALNTISSTEKSWGESMAIAAPYDPESLLAYKELSPHLSPNIDSYVQNIEGFGYQSVPVAPWMNNLDDPKTHEIVKTAMEVELWQDAQEEALAQEQAFDAMKSGLPHDAELAKKWEAKQDGEDDEEEMVVTDEEVDAKIEEIRTQLKREKFLFDAFFNNAVSDRSFVELRRIVRDDIESHGWGVMEFIRDSYGRLKRLNYIPGYTVRPLKDEGRAVEVMEDDSITPISDGREIKVFRRFRRYVQMVNGKKLYFKSAGDPRVVSNKTGKIYKDIKHMLRVETEGVEDKKDWPKPANEVIWFSLHNPKTPCPPPRWIGNLLAVLGTREADEVNYYYFSRKGIPPGLLFVQGGRIGRQLKERLEARVEEELYGTENFNKMLVVEAKPSNVAPDKTPTIPQLHYESLSDSQRSDGLFTEYDVRSADKIGASFRLPRLLRGETKDFNRATAIASLRFAEQQVFQPERSQIDWIYNKYIIPEIGIKYLQFRSNTPPTRSPDEVGELVKKVAPHGGFVPKEIRLLMGDLLNQELENIDEPWTQQPMPMTLAGMNQGEAPPDDDVESRLAQIENRIGEVVTAELRDLGYEMDVTARLLPTAEGDDDDEEEGTGQDAED